MSKNREHQPVVAVITRTKDRLVLLRRAVESVLGQTFENWVHVIINDGGDPMAVSLTLEEYAPRYGGRLQLLHNPNPTGMQNASNRAIQESESTYLAIHDDDDSWDSQFLESTVACLEELPGEERKAVITKTRMVYEEILANGSVEQTGTGEFFWSDAVSLFRTAAENTFPPIALLYRRSLHDLLGMYNQKYNVLGDWDWNLRMLGSFEIHTIPEILANYHHRSNSGNSDYGNSVTSGVSEHVSKDILLRNDYLRMDLESNRSGLGFLVNFSGIHLQNENLACARYFHIENLLTKAANAPDQPAKAPGSFWDRLLRKEQVVSILPEYAPKGLKRPGGVSMSYMKQMAEKARALSLDVFDTALFRLVRNPTDIFLMMEPQARSITGISTLDFRVVRIACERIARNAKQSGSAHSEVSLGEIYRVIEEKLSLNREQANLLNNLELETEFSSLYANPKILSLANGCHAAGKPVIYVSDMYLDSDFIGRKLTEAGFPKGEILVSCEHDCTKWEGALHDKALKRIGLPASSILHIGDHPVSDDVTPRKKGFSTICYKKTSSQIPFVEQVPYQSTFRPKACLGSILSGITRKKRIELSSSDFANEDALSAYLTGYEICGPLYVGFLMWVAKNAKKDGIDRLYMLARDGFNLLEVWKLLSAKFESLPPASYLLASRSVFLPAVVQKLDAVAIAALCKITPGLTVRDFMNRAFLSPEKHMATLQKLKLDHLLDVSVMDETGTLLESGILKRFEAILNILSGDLDRGLKERREILFDYLKSEMDFSKNNGIVDIGWSATSLTAMERMRLTQPESNPVRGYFFGTWEDANRPFISSLVRSFFFHFGSPDSRASVVRECVELVETFFVATHPSVRSLMVQNGKFVPEYGESEFDETHLSFLENFRKGSLDFTADILETATLDHLSEEDSWLEYISAALYRILKCPDAKEGKFLGSFLHTRGFGNSGELVPLAALPNKQLCRRLGKTQAHNKAFQEAYWRNGLLAQIKT